MAFATTVQSGMLRRLGVCMVVAAILLSCTAASTGAQPVLCTDKLATCGTSHTQLDLAS